MPMAAQMRIINKTFSCSHQEAKKAPSIIAMDK